MASDFHLEIDGVKGESEDGKHKDQIEILSFSWGATNAGSHAAAGGGGAGKVSFQDVHFTSHVCKASPLIAQLARHIDCPIHGVRVVRLADRNKFWAEVTDPIEPTRDAEGKIDVAATTQVIANVVESWVREHPDQWLWQHRRWR